MTPRIITGRDPASGRPLAVQLKGGRIAAIGDGPPDETAFLSAGLIDLQVNGYAGHDLNAPGLQPGTVAALARALRRQGVTTFLPTLITAAEDCIIEGLRAIAAARVADPIVRRMIPFAHVEGPFISPADGPRGAHPREWVRPPDLHEVKRWQDASGGLVGMVTLSPHWNESHIVIAGLAGAGLHVAIGHTDADPEKIRLAVAAGARLSTHLGNGVAATLPRHPNLLWAQLAEARLHATFIADGHHLPADTLAVMLRAKGLDCSILVSDSAAPGGLPPGVYEGAIGGRVELTPDGRLEIPGTPYLAGAALPLLQGVANAATMTGIPLADALRLATVNPGRFVGGRGVLEVGEVADLIRFYWSPGDEALAVETVLIAGREER